jgi:CRP/FNR family transcriptional regulator
LVTRYSIHGKGKTIVNQGEETSRVYFVCAGLVKVTRFTGYGGEVILDLLGPCSLIGGVNPQKQRNASYWSAETVTEVTEVAYLKADDLFLLFQPYPELGIGLSRYLSARLRAAYGMIADMKLPVEDRLLALLARIMMLLHEKCENGPAALPLTHRELAQFAQMTPETLSRALHALRGKGIINVEKRGIQILQAEALRKYSEAPNERP